MAEEERPIRPAGQGVMRAFAGRDPATGAYFGEPLSQLEEFLVNQVDPFLWLLSAPVCICVALRLECARAGAQCCGIGALLRRWSEPRVRVGV